MCLGQILWDICELGYLGNWRLISRAGASKTLKKPPPSSQKATVKVDLVLILVLISPIEHSLYICKEHLHLYLLTRQRR